MPLYGESSVEDSAHETGLWLMDKGGAAFPSFIPCDEKIKTYLKEALKFAGEPDCLPYETMFNLPLRGFGMITMNTLLDVKREPDDLRQENLDNLLDKSTKIPEPAEESERKKSSGVTDFQKKLFSVFEYFIKERNVTFLVDCSRFPDLAESIVGFPTQCMSWPQE